MKKAFTPRWDEIFAALETWYAGGASGGPPREAPSVTSVAEKYRHDPWSILVSTIISLRTKDEVTLAASERLLEKAPGPGELLALGEEETARLIYPAGFYRTKAASLMKTARIILERWKGQVPASMDALLALPGAGRKTANLVLSEAFGMDAICVDTHVHRISNRLGWTGPEGTASPEKTEAALRAALPKKYWSRVNALLVRYGQEICRPISPWCSRCLTASWCPRLGVTKSR
jgi:endonuclease-3